MITNISILSSPNIAAAHASINDCIIVIVDKFVKDGANLVDTENAPIILQAALFSFSPPDT